MEEQNLQQATEFFGAVFKNARHGQVNIWSDQPKESSWCDPRNPKEAAEIAISLSSNANVYFGVGLRKKPLGKKQRGRSEDIISLPCVWLDLDVQEGVHANKNRPTESQAKALLNVFPLEPSIIVHSGGGWHCYWLFDQPLHIHSEEDRQSAERTLKRFQNVFIRSARSKGWIVDNTSDLARVLRVPGTFNRKAEPKPVRILKLHSEQRYSVQDLLDAIEKAEENLPPDLGTERQFNREYTETQLPDADASKIVSDCLFIQEYLKHKEVASYSEWLAALTIGAYCENGEHLVHEWSQGHPSYSEREVDRKYEEIRNHMKPRTCAAIHEEFGTCAGCKHFGKINSPIALGLKGKINRETRERKVFKNTDLGNAERLVYRHGQNIRYNHVFGKWYIWDGKRWNEDKSNQLKQLAKDTVRNIYKEAYEEEDADKRKALSEHAMRSESRARIEAMISLAESEVPVLPDDMDRDIWLFNCQNGVIDLKTGDLLPHKREYMMTKISPVAYDPNAECPTWIKFLEDIMQDENGNIKHELIDFLQKAIGYSLTGDTSEQVVFFLYGTGRNGKSTFVNTIKEILGDYGKQTNADTFTVKRSDRVNNDIAALKGARFVAATESEEGARLAESLIKQITGGDPIAARFLHQEWFEYVPQYKIFFTTNHKPVIRGGDEGIWRRIRLIPFTVTIPLEKLDKDLPQKLRGEMPGILRWAVEGCLKWQQEGLGNPKEVQEATQGYKEEMDTLGNFIKENCVIVPSAKCAVSELYKKYTEWCEDNGEFVLSRTKFNRKIEERGFKKERSTGGNYYFFGIGLRSDIYLNSYSPNSEQSEVIEEKKTKFGLYKETQKNAEKASLNFTSSLESENPAQKVVPEYI
ncbi:phage/plasmid primase, P4 family [Parageobacillus thermoglucosidasius]|uniref:DNA primase family protein n=1 Tax=Parageobacillus thermoglucosidasius TaxID=1426 RepID=UPI000E180D00|nr:phage/plasmid primase, P4 family [Parageobacillus thermoglucosidasius]MED4903968.1 phage/plasmid primase, P4 family [Parageobacillus thermoglucosidasius]MED4915708.1 phage/plasmid primase, P4 family [Parageobacillus thermoglucosidasius]MED4945541.1 phage/plasmid primase, P4 family [Parageobacillus thermoglucosidasius]MED4984108.1 phage/plasmid primase, P4 family [Parageobacillus thermoglucosidasius]RDE18566.1 DNA primase [Parageobacillus thermoglucosidasius]